MTVSAPRSAAEARLPQQPGAAAAPDLSQEVPWFIRTLLGVLLIALGVTLLYALITLWPAIEAATAENPTEKTVTWLGFWSYTPDPNATLLILVVLVSALGSYVHAAVSFTDYVGNRQLARSWIWWYLLRVFVGAALAVLFYFAVRAGFLGAGTDTGDINPYGMAALAGLVGLFSKQATDKLREIFDTAFRVAPGYGDDTRADSIMNPAPVLDSSEPPRLRAGAIELTLVGSGFVNGSTVRVSQPGGVDVPLKVKASEPQRLTVELNADDVVAPGPLLFVVSNPSPGGGTSRILPVAVDPLEDTTQHGVITSRHT